MCCVCAFVLCCVVLCCVLFCCVVLHISDYKVKNVREVKEDLVKEKNGVRKSKEDTLKNGYFEIHYW